MQAPRRFTRTPQPPPYLRAYKTNHVVLLGPTATFSSTSGTQYPLQRFVSYSKLSPAYRLFVHTVSHLVEPANYEQASHDLQWVEAMNFEIESLEENHTWSMVPLPSSYRPIGCKWVFNIKYHADGTIEYYKA